MDTRKHEELALSSGRWQRFYSTAQCPGRCLVSQTARGLVFLVSSFLYPWGQGEDLPLHNQVANDPARTMAEAASLTARPLTTLQRECRAMGGGGDTCLAHLIECAQNKPNYRHWKSHGYRMICYAVRETSEFMFSFSGVSTDKFSGSKLSRDTLSSWMVIKYFASYTSS